MSDLDFFVDLVITGTVLGLDHTSELATVEEILGYDRTFDDASNRRHSDFGLVEFGWDRGGPRKNWEVIYFGAQVHRLPWLVREPHMKQVGAVLADRYGDFRSRLDFDELRAAVRARGFTLEERPSSNNGCVEYWEPTSRMGVLAVRDPVEAGWPDPAGTVIKMLGPSYDRSAWIRFGGRAKSFAGYAIHLLTLSDLERVAWLDKREPEARQERTEWWTYLRAVVSRRTGGSPSETRQWRRLGLALDRHAAERGVDSEVEAAVTLALSVLDAGAFGPADDLPTVDDAVQRWLAAMAGLFAEAKRLCAHRLLSPDEIRLARRLRNQIHDIHPCLPSISSAAVADELRAWTDLKPDLL